jgi:hypothetical protein
MVKIWVDDHWGIRQDPAGTLQSHYEEAHKKTSVMAPCLLADAKGLVAQVWMAWPTACATVKWMSVDRILKGRIICRGPLTREDHIHLCRAAGIPRDPFFTAMPTLK